MALQTFTAGQVLTAAQVTALQANDYNQTVSNKTDSYTLVAADKGTRIVMNKATATTITVNTGLFAAGDTLFIQNIGAGACTITAGTATVSSSGSLVLPANAGGTLYFTSTGVAIFLGNNLVQNAWTSWTPTLSSGFTNGTGTWNAKYIQIGKTVIANGYFTAGNGTKNGMCAISLPVTPLVGYNIFGTAGVAVSPVADFLPTYVSSANSTTFIISAINTSATYATITQFTAAIPFTWAVGSIITFLIIYEAA